MKHDKSPVVLQEVGPRDGLQNEPQVLSPQSRAKLIDMLSDAGLTRIQIGSFVNPRAVPQMAGTDKVWELIEKQDSVRYSVLVLNERGLEQALEAGTPHVEIYASASDTHGRKNSNMGLEEASATASKMIRRATRSGLGVTAGVMCAFGCFYEGDVPAATVKRMVDMFLKEAPEEIALADTAGLGDEDSLQRIIEATLESVPPERITLHLHDTYGRGMANLQTALSFGIRCFDTSVGGLGGCPFIPGAKGNISTERTVELLESMGYFAGADVTKLRVVRSELERLLKKPIIS